MRTRAAVLREPETEYEIVEVADLNQGYRDQAAGETIRGPLDHSTGD